MAGLCGVRESIGWRLAQDRGSCIDLARALRIQASAKRDGMQLLWTLVHHGLPDDLRRHDDAMIPRLARASLAALQAMRQVLPHARFLPIGAMVHVVAPLARPELASRAAQVAVLQARQQVLPQALPQPVPARAGAHAPRAAAGRALTCGRSRAGPARVIQQRGGTAIRYTAPIPTRTALQGLPQTAAGSRWSVTPGGVFQCPTLWWLTTTSIRLLRCVH